MPAYYKAFLKLIGKSTEEWKVTVERSVKQHERRADENGGSRLVSNLKEKNKLLWREVNKVRKGKPNTCKVIKDVNEVMLKKRMQ